MFFVMTNKKVKWQKSYIRYIFKNAQNKNEKYTSILLRNLDLLNKKNEYLPMKLFKFYAPTSDNILDIKYKRLWLSHPDSFNDPFDCKIGYDSLEFEKQIVIEHLLEKYLVENGNALLGFTVEEIDRLSKSTTSWEHYYYGSIYSKIEYYDFLFSDLLRRKNEKLQIEIKSFIQELNVEMEYKVSKIKELNIRVACFSNLRDEKEFINKNQMWAHYADNHRGFCVEYDISPLKGKQSLKYEDYRYYNNKEDFLDERRTAILKGGLFPVIYTSNRVSIPISKLKMLYPTKDLKLINNNYFDELLYKTYITKSPVWSYEREWRIILDEKICNYYDNKIPFPYIKKIYIGCRMENKYIDLLTDIAEEHNVDIVLMKEDGNKFYMNQNLNKSYKWKKEFEKYQNPYA